MSLLDKQLADELHCSVCWETMGEPITLVCGHNVCRGCLGGLIDTANNHSASGAATIACPTCRTRGRASKTMPENKVIKSMCTAARTAAGEACPQHPTTRAEVYCSTCDTITCHDCGLFGVHKKHDLCPLAQAAATCRTELERVQASHAEAKTAVRRADTKVDAVFSGLSSRVDHMANSVIEEVERLRDAAKSDVAAMRNAAHDVLRRASDALQPIELELETTIAELPRLDRQRGAVHDLEEASRRVEVPTWDAARCEGALQRFEGLTSFKKLKEHLKDQMAPIVYPIFLRVQVADTHTISMHVHSDTSVASIVNRLAHPGGIVGVPADKMRLVYKGKCLADEDHMVTHGIERDATIEVRLVHREHQTTSFHQRVIEKRKAAEEAEAAAAAAAAMPPPAKKPCRRGPARNARERRR